MEKKSYKMHADEHNFRSCVEKGGIELVMKMRSVEKKSEDEEECKVVAVKMNMSCKDVLCIKNEVYL